jgi:sarcosine/dimethylglycine N-methyltransferase
MAGLEAHYSARDIEARILAAVRAAGLNPEQRLSPEELGALDHFHTGGLRASRELLELAQIRAAQKAGNARRSLQEGQIRLVRGIFRVT